MEVDSLFFPSCCDNLQTLKKVVRIIQLTPFYPSSKFTVNILPYFICLSVCLSACSSICHLPLECFFLHLQHFFPKNKSILTTNLTLTQNCYSIYNPHSSCLNRAQQTFSGKSQMVNVSDFAGPTVSDCGSALPWVSRTSHRQYIAWWV